jgi:hypothetical protein
MLQVLIAISQSFLVEKRHGAIQKVIHKKERKNIGKNGQVSHPVLRTKPDIHYM